MNRSEVLVVLTRVQEPFFTTPDETTALVVLDQLGPTVSMQKRGHTFSVSMSLEFISLVKLVDDTSMGAYHELDSLVERKRRFEVEAQIIARTVAYLTGKAPAHDD